MSSSITLAPQQLISIARHFKFSQRQDSLDEQLVDLIPTLNRLGLNNLSRHISDSIKTYTEQSDMARKYVAEINKINFDDFQTPETESHFAQRLAPYLGCYDAADYFKHLDI